VTPEQIRIRSYAAKALLDDATIADGWKALEDDLRGEWERCLFSRKRDRIWTELKHLRNLRSKLATFAGQSRE